MITRENVMWYCIFGILTCIIGIVRYIKNKQAIEPDELTIFSWFLVWPIWIVLLIIRIIQKNFK